MPAGGNVLPDNDQVWMQRALSLAASVLYVPSPNPRVGCVIVRDGVLLAEGATQLAGQAHAEVMALRQLQSKGLDAQGATVYVTLEPCSHWGRTPPCVNAVIQARPARVVIAQVDPNPAVAGRGVAALREAGIDVTVGVGSHEALEINPGFVSRMLYGMPYVWAKIAGSVDGFTATSNGISKWITGAQARSDGHHWRARSCVVLTGIGTVKADDPLLNVREVSTPRQPRRAVVDTRLEMPLNAKLLETGGLILFTASKDQDAIKRFEDQGAQVVCLPDAEGRVDLHAMMHWLASQGMNEVHVEAGARLNGALWQAGLVDELLLYVAPMLLGNGAPLLQIPAVQQLQAQDLAFVDCSAVGQDLRIRLRKLSRWQDMDRQIGQSNLQWQ